MKMTRGTWRIVILLPEIGLVIKFPKVKFKKIIGNIWIILKDKDKVSCFKSFFLEPLEYNSDTFPSYFYYYAFHGISSNWNEYLFYKQTKNQFLQETYFSIFGFVNIQKMGFQLDQKEGFKRWNFREQMDRLTENQARTDQHHWFVEKNFCVENEKLKTFDYGSKKCQKIIEQYGEKVHNSFNFQENLEAEY